MPSFKATLQPIEEPFFEEDSNGKYLKRKIELSPSISTSKCGLVVSVTNPWLGATPDGLVHDPTSDPPDRLVEFKNPHTVRNMTLDETVTKLQLKAKHGYYYQMQCAMYCTNCK